MPKAKAKTNTAYIIVQPQIESQLNSSQGISISRGLHVCEEYKDHPNPANKWIISNHICKTLKKSTKTQLDYLNHGVLSPNNIG